ncbi:hypothetical protein [Microbacterium laevaniformans]|uniref:hypothetical protein n=1 Tax=Microbacterium laevaniformans TaxID=36807 RepID=UPI003D972EAD
MALVLSEPTHLDIVAAAERHHCSVKAVRRRIDNGCLPAVKARFTGRDGRPVVKIMIEVKELDAAFAPVALGPAAHERLIAEVSAAAPRFSESQRARIAAVLRMARPEGDTTMVGVSNNGAACVRAVE